MPNSVKTKLAGTNWSDNTATGWSPIGTPTTTSFYTDSLKVGLAAHNTPASGGPFYGGQLWAFEPGTINIAASSQLNIGGSYPAGSPGNYSIYIADGSSFRYSSTLALVNTQGTTTHDVFVGAGGSFEAEYFFTSTTGVTNVRKHGAGDFRVQSGNNPTNIDDLTMMSGRIRALGTTGVGSNALALALIFNGGELNFYGGGGRSVASSITMTGAGTISVDSGTVTFTSAPTAGGTLTIAGNGTVAWSANIAQPVSVNSTSTLSMGASNNLSGTLSGGGTIGMSNGAISGDAPTFTGNVTGNFNYSGSNRTFGGQVTGEVTVAASASVTFSRTATHTGVLQDVKNGSTATVRGTFAGGTASTYTDVWYDAVLRMDGPNANVSGAGNPNISVWDKGTLWLTGGATVTPLLDLTWDSAGAQKGSPTIGSDDVNHNRYTGTLSCAGDAATRGSIKLLSKTGGIFEIGGSAVNYGTNTRPFNINDGTFDYAGEVRITGSGFTAATTPIDVFKGTLHINRAGSVALGSGLTVRSGARLAFSSTGAYAAQLSGAVTLNAGSTMKFGAP